MERDFSTDTLLAASEKVKELNDNLKEEKFAQMIIMINKSKDEQEFLSLIKEM